MNKCITIENGGDFEMINGSKMMLFLSFDMREKTDGNVENK
jgi:hypothetical protein